LNRQTENQEKDSKEEGKKKKDHKGRVRAIEAPLTARQREKQQNVRLK